MQPSVRGQIRTLIAVAVVGAAAGAGALFFFGGRRMPEPGPSPSRPAQPAATLPGLGDKVPPGNPDPLKQIFGDGLPEATVRFALPELPFEEHSAGLPTSGTWRGYPLLHDFTGDGLCDLVVSNREEDGYNAWEASKTGPWVRHIEGLERDMAYGPARAGDVNADGIPDLILSAHSDALRVYLNDGRMGWTRSAAKIENPNLMLDVAVGNLNGDAFPDVVGIAHFDGGLGVYLGDGKGGLVRRPESGTLMPRKTMGRVVELEDIDGDGTDDIVTTTDRGVKVFLTQSGDPLSWKDVSIGLPSPDTRGSRWIGNSIYAVRVGRFVTGGWPQIVACGLTDPTDATSEGIGVYAFDEQSKTWAHIDSGVPRTSRYRDCAVADLDKDGHLDMVVMSLDDGGAVLLGDGRGGFRAHGRLTGVSGRGLVTIGEVDGDGWPDVAVIQPAEKDHPELGSVRVLLNRPAVWKKP